VLQSLQREEDHSQRCLVKARRFSIENFAMGFLEKLRNLHYLKSSKLSKAISCLVEL